MKEMFEASVDGQPFDNARWGNYYRPYGLEAPAGAKPAESAEQSAPRFASAPVAAPVAESAPTAPWEDDVASAEKSFSEPIVVPKAAPSSDKTQDILAMIRARQNKPA
jgi:hypothetical protein